MLLASSCERGPGCRGKAWVMATDHCHVSVPIASGESAGKGIAPLEGPQKNFQFFSFHLSSLKLSGWLWSSSATALPKASPFCHNPGATSAKCERGTTSNFLLIPFLRPPKSLTLTNISGRSAAERKRHENWSGAGRLWHIRQMASWLGTPERIGPSETFLIDDKGGYCIDVRQERSKNVPQLGPAGAKSHAPVSIWDWNKLRPVLVSCSKRTII